MIDFDAKEPAEGQENEEVEMVDLFTFGGKTYSIPNKEKPLTGLKYIYVLRTQGLAHAEAWMGLEVMGPETYSVLMDVPNLDPDDFGAIMNVARSVIYGTYVPKDQSESEAETPNGTDPKPNSQDEQTPKPRQKRKPAQKTSSGS